jgi:formamidopyrimidine-DNA glycosylase
MPVLAIPGSMGQVPEGDTVWLAARRLDAALAGASLVRGELRVPRYGEVDLAGRTVLDVRSRGKHLLARLSDDMTLHTHLRMDGSWHVYRRGERWRGGPSWQVRAVLTTSRNEAVGYRLPVVDLIPTRAERSVVGHLGPDLLGPDWEPAEAVRRLLAEPTREIGQALLDQRVMAGLGNLYRTELCFLVGVTPWTPVGELPDVDRLANLAHLMLMTNRERVEQITTGQSGQHRQHWVFERRTCLRCSSTISTALQGPAARQRITYWCPVCQRGPAPPTRPVHDLLGPPPARRPRRRP